MGSSKNNDTSWVNIEGDENFRKNQELDEEKVKIEIKNRIKNLKKNSREKEEQTSETIDSMIEYLNELQNTEEELYELLKDENDETDKNEIINKINNLSSKRDSLYKEMKQLSIGIDNKNSNTSTNYKNQLNIVKVAEKQLNTEKERLKILNAEKYNKLRMVEINTYYSKRYQALGYVTIVVIIFFLVALIINILTNRNIIPLSLANIVNPLLIGIAVFILIYAYYDILKRSNYNFDEYTWMKPGNSSSGDGVESGLWPEPNIGICVGETCCSEGTEYDSTSDTCKAVETTSEGFVNAKSYENTNNVVTSYNKSNNFFALN